MKKLLKFYADWCGQCRVLDKNLTMAQIESVPINVELDTNAELIEKYNIKTIPALVLIDDNDDKTILKKQFGILNIAQLKDFIE